MRSEYSANKALFESAYKATKLVAKAFNANSKPEAKLNDMESMKEFQAKAGVFGKATYTLEQQASFIEYSMV